ncbi:MAG: ribbon-helix-helix domain-containing protein [Prolixibacteraceae bacterium]|nr:ribbon-helix-helix domain-containing protein [Prolixibacteraceae bacterium]
MAKFTSSLPDSLLNSLNSKAKQLNIPKNKIIEKALKIYLDQLNRAEYIQAYKKVSHDISIIDIAEEGMEDYLKQIKD